MKKLLLLAMVASVVPQSLGAQGLREVPQRFVFVQPLGLILGVGQAGVEFTVGRTTTLELGVVGVYSRKDGIKMYGGGPGIGVRQYLGQSEAAGFVVGARADGVWLEADNSDALLGFLSLFPQKRNHVYLGLGLLGGYRWVSTGGWFLEPSVSYEYFAGPRPLVAGSRDLQEALGLSVGVAFGLAW